MSINIHIFAKRKITFKKKNGKRSGAIQEITFPAWQTPTDVSRAIMRSPDPAQEYKDWVERDCSRDDFLFVYAEDDLFEEGEPVGTVEFNQGKEHLRAFEEWLGMCDEEGFEVFFEAH